MGVTDKGNEGDQNTADALIDEVRGIRREISERFGGDVDRLCDHLATIMQDYEARRGVFAGVSKERAAKIVESWGEEAQGVDDPLIDEVHAVRKRIGRGK